MTDPEASQVYNADVVGTIDSENDIGQSFKSRRPDVNAITLWVSIPPSQGTAITNPATRKIRASLYTSPDKPNPIFVTSIQAPASGSNVALTIPISDLKTPAYQEFYLLISTEPDSLLVNGRNEDAYTQGQAYINGTPFNADIAFRLSYNYGPAALFQDLQRFLSNAWIVLPLIILLWLPGWLLLDISGLRNRFDFGEQVAISCGLSLAIIPVLVLWTTTLNLLWSQTVIWITFGVLIALFIYRLLFSYLQTHRTSAHSFEHDKDTETINPKSFAHQLFSNTFALLLIFVMTLMIRLIMVRDLATPAWVDSVHHALITRLIMNNGGFPATYLPYLNIPATDYHPGFHSIAAFFTWLSQFDLASSLLVLGQAINALCIFSVFLLTKTLTRNSTAGIVAAFISGFLTPMPAYYTSWGRYTELTGLVIFPVVMALIQAWMEDKSDRNPGWYLFLGALASAGLFMIHYRVIVFLACLVIAFILIRLVFRNLRFGKKLTHILLFILTMLGLSILLVLPWIIPTVKNTLLPVLSAPVTTSASPLQDFPWAYLTSALGKQAMVLAGLGLIWSIIKKQAVGYLLAAWVLLMFLLANLDSLRLPGGSLITNLSVEISLFIPIAVLGGYFASQVIGSWKKVTSQRLAIPTQVITLIIFVCVGYLGAKQLVAILNPATLLSRQADLSAIQWVKLNIPEYETIVLNPFAWGYGLYAGNDGGYWLEPLAGQLTLPPPVLYGLSADFTEVSQQCQNIITLSSDPPALRDYLLTKQYHYIFIGARGGVIPPQKLSSSGFFDLVYNQDGVRILKVKP
ncbi:MAG: hypothetical protein C3F13_10315 [Anaerolineales bacterium]|nr:MAG: hypothetical protein C3F13_10315 [Anaerolineales bacterium]